MLEVGLIVGDSIVNCSHYSQKRVGRRAKRGGEAKRGGHGGGTHASVVLVKLMPKAPRWISRNEVIMDTVDIGPPPPWKSLSSRTVRIGRHHM
jgi:hypothetical protein